MADLALAEHEHQVDDLLRRGIAGDTHWIALGPSAMAHLERLGIPFRLPEEFGWDALEEVCREGHQRLASLCTKLDSDLLARHPDLERAGLHPFRFHLFSLVSQFDGIVSRLHLLKRILRSFSTATVVRIHSEAGESASGADLSFSNQDTLWGKVAALLQPSDLRIRLLPEPTLSSPETLPGRSVRKTLRGALLRSVERSLWKTTFAQCLDRKDYRGLLDLGRTGKAVLVLGGAGEWHAVIPALRKAGIRVLFVREEYFGKPDYASRSFGSQSTASLFDAKIAPELVFEGVSFLPLLAGRLSWIATEAPALFRRSKEVVETIGRRHHVEALLSSGASSGLSHAIQQTAVSARIRVYTWQHGISGANGVHCQFCEQLNSLTSTKVLTWGPSAALAHEMEPRGGAEIVTVGSAALDRIGARRRTASRAPKQILYATTNYYQNNWYFGMPPGFSDRFFYLDQKAIVEGLRRMAGQHGIQPIVKLHPSRLYLDPPWLKEMAGDGSIRFVKEQASFTDLLDTVDAVILDSPTTTALQTLAAGLPLFALTRHWEHSPEGLAMLGRRAVLARTVAELLPKIETFLSEGHYPADVENREFLRAYGVHLDDGRSAERAARVVCESLLTSPAASSAATAAIEVPE